MAESVIHLLPDSVANQIAAGEVIQRPASIVKELVENSIDAGATSVRVVIKDAGRTLVQVTDDGCGMSCIDAQMAFERHATSKIKEATDLYTLCTMGFRGEALASIAAVAQVELLTKRSQDELGLRLEISASQVLRQEPAMVPNGSSFRVKNLFFNLPARRRFLKSDAVELRHITSEFIRVALAHPDVAMSMTVNDLPSHVFPSGNLRQRVAAVAGKALSNDLLPIETETSMVKIRGFIGTPQTAKKSSSDQYFFANWRFMKHPYLHKAVMDAYKNIIAPDVAPSYFIYLEVSPDALDVNIHPQKTEIKFENDTSIWQILNAAVRECLGKFNVVPSLDFQVNQTIDIPPYIGRSAQMPSWSPDVAALNSQNYNPFDYDSAPAAKVYNSSIGSVNQSQPLSTQGVVGEIFPSSMDISAASGAERFMQLRGRYIATQVQSGLMIIDQRRAHERIQFDALSKVVGQGNVASQRLVFPEIMSLGSEDACIVEEMSVELQRAGLEVHYDAAAGQLTISAVPSVIEASEARGLIEALLYDYREGELSIDGGIMEYVVKTLAMQSAIPYGKQLSSDEMSSIYDRLFASANPSLTPHGKVIFTIINMADIESHF